MTFFPENYLSVPESQSVVRESYFLVSENDFLKNRKSVSGIRDLGLQCRRKKYIMALSEIEGHGCEKEDTGRR